MITMKIYDIDDKDYFFESIFEKKLDDKHSLYVETTRPGETGFWYSFGDCLMAYYFTTHHFKRWNRLKRFLFSSDYIFYLQTFIDNFCYYVRNVYNGMNGQEMDKFKKIIL